MWEPRRLTTLWASTSCYRNSFTLLFPIWLRGAVLEVLIFRSPLQFRFRRRNKFTLSEISTLCLIVDRWGFILKVLPICCIWDNSEWFATIAKAHGRKLSVWWCCRNDGCSAYRRLFWIWRWVILLPTVITSPVMNERNVLWRNVHWPQWRYVAR
jgi:hypothetical protein